MINEPVPVGSRVTCNPPPTDTDADYLVLVYDLGGTYEKTLELAGFKWNGEETYAHQEGHVQVFNSYTLGDGPGRLNYICTADLGFYGKFLHATALAKRFNLLKKQDRIDLFKAILYGDITNG
jgi:hypothetical protein